MIIGSDYFSSVQQQCELIETFVAASDGVEGGKAIRLITKRGAELLPQILERVERVGCALGGYGETILHPPNSTTGEAIFIVWMPSNWIYSGELKVLRETYYKWYLMYDYTTMGAPDSLLYSYFGRNNPREYTPIPMERVFPLL